MARIGSKDRDQDGGGFAALWCTRDQVQGLFSAALALVPYIQERTLISVAANCFTHSDDID